MLFSDAEGIGFLLQKLLCVNLRRIRSFFMLGMLISIVSGTLMALQGIFNTQVTKQTSEWVSASFVQFSALIVCLAAWFITGREGSFSG